MLKIIIEDRGAREVLERKAKGLEKAVGEGFAEAGEMIVSTAREIAPVRTGALRNSIYYALEPWRLVVGAAVHYAAFVEYGTRKMAPRPYLRPAVWSHLNDLINSLRKAILSR